MRRISRRFFSNLRQKNAQAKNQSQSKKFWACRSGKTCSQKGRNAAVKKLCREIALGPKAGAPPKTHCLKMDTKTAPTHKKGCKRKSCAVAFQTENATC